MLDLIGFQCQIVIEDLADILKILSMTLNDVTVPVTVHLERIAPFSGDDRGIPFAGGYPNEGEDKTDPFGSIWLGELTSRKGMQQTIIQQMATLYAKATPETRRNSGTDGIMVHHGFQEAED